jgi:pyruvate/2-oxoglutarate dehydrogenase complex dihydrolipoamide dehydrogenase (E3) component
VGGERAFLAARSRRGRNPAAIRRGHQPPACCGIVGPNAGDLIADAALAIEMGADAQDIGLTVHPPPTLSETVAFAAEMFEDTITDLSAPKKK